MGVAVAACHEKLTLGGAVMKKVLAVVVVSLAVACGSPNNTGTGGGSATGGGSGGGSATGGSGNMGGGSGAMGGGAGTTTKTGLVYVNQVCTMVGMMTYCGGSARATFVTSAFTGSAACQTTTSGNCHVTECMTGDGGINNTNDNAGDVTIAGTIVDGGIKLTNTSTGYAPQTVTGRLWQGGGTLTLSTTGGTVPAISGKTVTAPADIMVTAPTCVAANCGALSRSADLNVTWTGSGNVDVIINSATTSQSELIICSFSSSPGTVPASMMGKIIPNATGVTNSIAVSPESANTFNAGDYTVTFTAAGNGAVGTFTAN
jgi:hypothetical protein